MKSAVIYARVSSDRQEKEGWSIPAQIDFLKKYAEEKCFFIEKIFSESETAKRAGRKAFNEMLKFCTERNINTILVEKTDRLYRNFKDYVILEDYDFEVHLAKEGTVISKNSRSHDKFIHGIKVLMAKNYIDNLSEEIRKGLDEKVSQGYYPHKAPVGYKTVKNSDNKKIIVPDEEKAPFVKRLFELYASGLSAQQVKKFSLKTRCLILTNIARNFIVSVSASSCEISTFSTGGNKVNFISSMYVVLPFICHTS